VTFFRFWPLLLYFSMIWLNTDFLIPVVKVSFSPGPIILALIIIPLASVELCYGYWMWGYWIRQRMGELEKFREIRRKLHQEGLLDRWIIDGILKTYRQTIDPNNKIKQKINRWGSGFIWVVAVFTPPGFGARSGSAAFCGVFREFKLFIHLVLANVAHALLSMGVWGWILDK